MNKNSATICAQLTPPGRGAVAVVGLLGPTAESALDQHFLPVQGKPFSQTRSRKIVYGLWQSTGEDLVVSRHAPDHFEVHCHGGNAALAAILQSLSASNIQHVSPATYARAFHDAWTVTTRIAVTEATTARTARILLNQLRILPSTINKLKLVIESNERETAITKIQQMLRWSKFGIHLTRPRSIVLCGQPNVGKSSLANAIIGFQRAIVHDTAGTTRDVVSQLTAIDGWPVELKDTAGLREATGTIEAIGIEKAKHQIDAADLRICVVDLSQRWTQRDQTLLNSISPHLIVLNKSDLAPERASQTARPDEIMTSVSTGEGIANMIERIGQLLVPDLPDPGQSFPVTESQNQKLLDLLSHLKNSHSDVQPDIDDLSIESV